MDEIKSAPYAEWLELVLRKLFEGKPASIGLCATLEDGSTMTAYYQCDAQDKAVFAHHIQNDVTMDVILANIDLLRDALEEDADA